MATNEQEDPAEPGRTEEILQTIRGAVAKVTDTDETMPLRAWVLLVLVALCCLTAPSPANAVGVVATMALALSAAPRLYRR